MAFDDLLAFFTPTLDLPIGGKTYTVQPPDHRTGLRILAWQALAQGAATAKDRERLRLADDDERDLLKDCLGPVYDQLSTDGVPYPALLHAGQTAFVWVTQDHCKGTTNAERYWAAPGKASTTSPPSPSGKASTRTAAATTTRTRASGSGTSATPSKKRAAAPDRSGRKS